MHPTKKKSFNQWPIVFLIAFLAALTVGYLAFKRSSEWSPFKTNVIYNTTILSAVERARSEGKLVVYSFEVSAEVVKSSSKSQEVDLLFSSFNVDLGTTTVSFRTTGNKVQCYVPLGNVTQSSFTADREGNRLVIRIPKPVVDEDIVEIKTDSRFAEVKTDVGWGRLDSKSGAHLREEAKRALRPAVIEEAKRCLAELYQAEAQKTAEDLVLRLLGTLKNDLREGVTLAVEFQ
jgi:hypothetical protein